MPLLTLEDGIFEAKTIAGDTHLGDENLTNFKISTTLTHHLEHVLAGISLGACIMSVARSLHVCYT